MVPSYNLYISQLIRFARTCSKGSDFNDHNLMITGKRLYQRFRFHKYLKTGNKLNFRYKDLV